MLDESKPIPRVEIRQPDNRPRCDYCGRLLTKSCYQFKPTIHNQCIAKRYDSRHYKETMMQPYQDDEPAPQDWLSAIDDLLSGTQDGMTVVQ